MATERDDRPWGYYEVVHDAGTFRIKRICVSGGSRLSYQRHRRRSEHWVVVAGQGVVTLDDEERSVGVGDMVAVPAGCAHRIENVGEPELVFVEVQTGDYFGEDDIERLDDDYGRLGQPAAAE